MVRSIITTFPDRFFHHSSLVKGLHVSVFVSRVFRQTFYTLFAKHLYLSIPDLRMITICLRLSNFGSVAVGSRFELAFDQK